MKEWQWGWPIRRARPRVGAIAAMAAYNEPEWLQERRTAIMKTMLVNAFRSFAARRVAVLASALLAPGIVGAAEGTAPAKAPGPMDWTGLYVGISAGAIFNDSDLKSNQLALVEDPCNRDIHSTSFLPGAHVGYLKQLENKLVLGGEADFTYPDSSGSADCPCYNSTFDRFTVKNRIQGALRGRVGYSLDYNLMPYITAGVSFADTALQYVNEHGDSYSQNSAQTGWVLGGGMEYGFQEHFSVRAEYLYTDYGDALNTRLPVITGFSDPNGQAEADLRTHTVRAALNYRF